MVSFAVLTMSVYTCYFNSAMQSNATAYAHTAVLGLFETIWGFKLFSVWGGWAISFAEKGFWHVSLGLQLPK